MAPRQREDTENQLYDTLSAAVDTTRDRLRPQSDAPFWASIEETAVVLATTAVGMMLLSQPAFAQSQELGDALCSSGAGWVATAAGVLAAVFLMSKGMARGVQAVDDMGSVNDQTRDTARKEAKGAATSFAGGLVGVPFVGALLGQLLPDSFGCIGFELNFLIVAALPF